MFKTHYCEALPPKLRCLFDRRGVRNLKIDFWNAFVDSDLIECLTADISVVPRFIPESYLPIIKAAAKTVTEGLLKFLSLPSAQIKQWSPPSEISDYLLKQLDVLKYRPRRLTGGMRYDFAIQGPLTPDNPPRLLEVNDSGYDGAGRASFIQETILKIFPELKPRVLVLNPVASEIRNLRRVGRDIARLQYELYNWDEEVLLKAARGQLNLRLISPDIFKLKLDSGCPLLKKARLGFRKGQIYISPEKHPVSACYFAYAMEPKDYREAAPLLKRMLRSTTTIYNPFLIGLIGNKGMLVRLRDLNLMGQLLNAKKVKFLQKVVPPTWFLEDYLDRGDFIKTANLVLKQVDGTGGEKVFTGREMLSQISKIRDPSWWIVQEKLQLNCLGVNGVLSRPKQVIADLGVYVNYDWEDGKFRHFEVAGFISRANNKGFKVNVSGGGLQVPVMIARGY